MDDMMNSSGTATEVNTARIVSRDFYGRPFRAPDDEISESAKREPERRPSKRDKPTHYKVICISMYTKDIENLESKVAELKRRGHTKANKSQLIRYALSKVDIDDMPPPQP